MYLVTAQSQYLMVIERNDGLSTLCHSRILDCSQSKLKPFPSPGYIPFGEEILRI